MKSEGEFSGLFSKELKKYWPQLYHIKASDKFTLGISDFLIWLDGISVALEMKFVMCTPSNKAMILKHNFSGAQVTFLESMSLAKVRAYGGVYLKETQLFYLIPYKDMPREGNWKTKEFLEKEYTSYKMWNEFPRLIGDMFGRQSC
jgi:hypothetical protein